MNEITDYLVPAGLLGALGALWGGAPTAVSPLSHGAGAPLTDDETKALIQAGALSVRGELSAGIRPALDILGTANAFTRVYLSGGFSNNEYLVCFAPSGASASLVNAGGVMSITAPALAEEFLGMIGESTGMSSFAGAPFEATLPADEAVVLAALIDAQRKASLKAVLDGKDPLAVELSAAAVAKLVPKSGENREWLADILLELLSSEGLSAEKVAPALTSLEGKGLVARSGDGFRLADAPRLLGQRMLVLDSVLTLTAGALTDDGGVAVAGFTCLAAGVHDLLYIDAHDDEVELRSVSAAELLEYARAFLTDATVVRKLQAAAGADTPPAAKRAAAPAAFCTKCGAKLAPGAAFCVKCGTKVG